MEQPNSNNPRSVISLWLRRFAGPAWFGISGIMTSLDEWGLALVFLLFALIAFFIQIHHWKGFDGRPHATTVAKILLAIFTSVAALFFGAVYVAKKAERPWSMVETLFIRPSDARPPKREPKPPPPQKTLHDRYRSDFVSPTHLVVELTTDVTLSNKRLKFVTEVEERIYFDWASRSRFITFYVPSAPDTFAVCVYLLEKRVGELLVIADKNINVRYQALGEQEKKARDTRFTGGVQIYHEDDLDEQARARLAIIAKRHKLIVALRGPMYDAAQRFYESRSR